jgi:signal transduction histidine kinase
LEVRLEQVKGRINLDPLPILEADPVQIWQLFQNLLSNALKFFKPDTPPVISISGHVFRVEQAAAYGLSPAWIQNQPANRRLCQIQVQDNGIGFDEKYLERIFIVFQRLHSRGVYEGAGVGLAICRKIVLRHGGEISARSQPGQGATFLVTLPVKQNIMISDDSNNEPTKPL